ncbi:hypothetical protein EMCG_01535 [[Emmonsia] crescens]|uniref:DUF7514 domain-containing protein n=1 Tax=[Emmonsia] crescens TaxID=73230 RepID=A0A0G2I0R1_9EURO|nr:hypothetical protein EMCG_01535 [Emmonsia crescens UAMH 3008]
MAFDGYHNLHRPDQPQWFSRATSVPPPPNSTIPHFQQYPPPYGNSYQPDISPNAITPQLSPGPPESPSPPSPNAHPNVPGSFPLDIPVGYGLHRRGPGNDATNTIANKADLSLNSELVAQVTTAVIQKLKDVNLEAHSQQQPFHAPPEPNRYKPPPATTSRPVYTSPFANKLLGDRQRSPIRENPKNSLWALSPLTPEVHPDEIRNQLFEKNGEPTSTMFDIMWNIGLHLYSSHWSNRSMAITPEKMLRYYQTEALSCDSYPWGDIFGQRSPALSFLYCEIGAEHILVQDRANGTPTVPALTPNGFGRWMGLFIKANPALEYMRIYQTVRKFPILHKNEQLRCFPKNMPTIIFLEPPDPSAREYLENAISKHCGINFHKQPPVKTRVTTESPGAPHYPLGGLFGGAVPTNVTDYHIPPPPLPPSSYSLATFGQPRKQKQGAGGGKLHEDSQEDEVVNTPTSARHDGVDHHHHHRHHNRSHRKLKRRYHDVEGGASANDSPADNVEGYDDNNNYSSKGNRNSETESYGGHQRDRSRAGSRAGSYAAVSGGARSMSHSHHILPQTSEYDGDDDDLQYIEVDEGEHMTYECSRDGDRERDREMYGDGDSGRLNRRHLHFRKELCLDDSSRGSWTEGQ